MIVPLVCGGEGLQRMQRGSGRVWGLAAVAPPLFHMYTRSQVLCSVLVCIARQLGTTEDLNRPSRKRVYDRAAGLLCGGLAEDAPWMCLLPNVEAPAAPAPTTCVISP